MLPSLLLLAMAGVASFFIISSSFKFISRAAGIMFLTFSSIIGFLLIQYYIGQPNEFDMLPSKIVVYGQMIEKDKIYIMYTENKNEPPPLFSTFPYTEELHSALAKGKKKFKGNPFTLESKKGKEGKSGKKGGDGKKGEGKGKESSLSNRSQTHTVIPAPLPEMPEKRE